MFPRTERPRKLGLLAGRGALPRQVAESCVRQEIPVFVIDLAGHAADWSQDYDGVRLSLGQVGAALSSLRAAGCDAVTMAGGIDRPNFSTLRFDMKGMRVLPRLLGFARGGDDGLLRGVATLFEEEGFRVVGPHLFLEGGVARVGRLAGSSPSEDAKQSIAFARRLLAALSPFDVGQAVVVDGARCLAVEATEGTSAMLARVAMLERAEAGGVLVKAPKRGQSRDVDLPAIGPQTVRDAAAAGLEGIAIEAGGVIVLEDADTRRLADESGLFLYAFEASA